MSPTIAVAHYPEGAGHATRMLAIARALEQRGVEVAMAGGGAGTQFVELNGYDEFEPATVDYIDTYQQGTWRDVLGQSLPASVDRVADYAAWFDDLQPDAVVTDDMFAAIAASRTDRPLYALKHDVPALYDDPVERAGARLHTWFQLSTTRDFFYPAVWPPDGTDPDGATRVGPVALDDGGRTIDAADVVVVPSYYSAFDDVAARLDSAGYDVLHVGSDDWEPVQSLLPYIRGADLVVCSGYSTIMDAAVAGTPCAVVPATSEQEAVADRLIHADTDGFVVADSADDVLAAAADPPTAPEFDNGADRVAQQVVADLSDPLTSPTDRPATPDGPAPPLDDVPSGGAGDAAAPARVAADARQGGQDAPERPPRDDADETADAETPTGPAAAASVVTGAASRTTATAAGAAATAASTSLSSAFDRVRTTGGPPASRSTIAWSLLVGKTDRAAATTLTALLLCALVAREVAVGGIYRLFGQLYPTFSSEMHAVLLLVALALVLLATVGSVLGAGALPSVLLASAPVVGWAANFWIGPLAPVSVGSPLRTVLMYGVVCGLVGYLLGIRLRPLVGERPRNPSRARTG